ncbi:SPOR domain-containing protein [bacterium]|nr:SPOR domain-containing protein [bacterium]
MRNLNKMRDRYQIDLDNKQVASIVFILIIVSVLIFFAGFFIGKKKCDIKTLECESAVNNVAIIEKKDSSTTKNSSENVSDNNLTSKKIENSEPNIDSNNSLKVENVDSNIKNLKDSNKTTKNDENILDKNPKKDLEKKDNGKLDEKNSIDLSKIDIEKVKSLNPDKNSNQIDSNQTEFKTSLKSDEKGEYIIQIRATTKKEDADKILQKLLSSGYKVFIESTESKGTLYYRVRLGFFKTRDDAKKFQELFEKESEYKETFITVVK